MIVTYAAKITKEIIPNLIEDAALFGLNVDYIEDNMAEDADFGEDCYAILSHNTSLKQATFTEMWGTDFFNNWHFTGGHYGARPHWKTVSLNTPKPR